MMKWLAWLWNLIVSWFLGPSPKPSRAPERPAPYVTSYVDGAYPPVLDARTIYVLTEDDDPWEARFICPCGCGSQLDLNLLEDTRPCWHVLSEPGVPATLHPSVWRKIGCRSHFWMRDGAVIWTKED